MQFLTPVLLVLVATAVAKGAQPDTNAYWPQWRGPAGTGVGQADAIPDEWDASKNVKWKVAIPGRGNATPIIWGDHVFVLTGIRTDERSNAVDAPTSAPQAEKREGRRGRGHSMSNPKPTQVHRFVVLCLDRKTGRIRWERTATGTTPHEGHHRQYGTFASASPVTDGKHVWAYFGSRGLYCYSMDGTFKWHKDFGKMTMARSFGEGCSPVLYGDRIIIKRDHEGDSFIVALDKHTGKEIWRTNRSEVTSWSTPVVVDVNGTKQVVASGTPEVRGYDLATGEELWHYGRLTRNVIPTVVYGHGLVFAASGFRGSAMHAIRLGGSGDLNNKPDASAWDLDRGTPYVPSPLLYGDELYLLQDKGTLSCHDAKTGRPHYASERLPGIEHARFHASPVGAGGKVYLLSEKGTCLVLKHSTKLEVLAINKIDERFNASPAVARDNLFLRGDEHLYCIGTR